MRVSAAWKAGGRSAPPSPGERCAHFLPDHKKTVAGQNDRSRRRKNNSPAPRPAAAAPVGHTGQPAAVRHARTPAAVRPAAGRRRTGRRRRPAAPARSTARRCSTAAAAAAAHWRRRRQPVAAAGWWAARPGAGPSRWGRQAAGEEAAVARTSKTKKEVERGRARASLHFNTTSFAQPRPSPPHALSHVHRRRAALLRARGGQDGGRRPVGGRHRGLQAQL